MKKLYFLLLLGTICTAQVTLPHYDGMNYTDGATLQTQTDWTSINSGDDLLVASGSLNYLGLSSSTGNKVLFQGTGIDSYKEFTPQTTGTIYFSFLLNVTDNTTQTSTTGGYNFGLIQAASTSIFGATIWTKRIDDTTYNIGINARTTAANTVFSTTAYTIGATYLVVGSYEIVDGTGNDIVNLYINPTPGQAAPAPVATMTNTGGTDFNASGAGRLLVRQGSATDTPAVEFDELRIGTTWADVTPAGTASTKSFDAIPGLSLFPNPVTGNVLNITSTANLDMNVAIFDVLGKQVINTKVTNNTVNVSNLNAGVYIVKVTEDGKTATRKLVVK